MSKVNIPKHLKASTPDLLRELMLENSLISTKDVRYFDISFDGKDWFVWFYEEIDLQGLLMKANAIKKRGK